MLIIPAIDIMNGACVRLYQGDFRKARKYDGDPEEVAIRFQTAGARRIHVVDLDAARNKGSNNRDVIRRIVESTDVEIEVGGGIRTERDVEALKRIGVDTLIVGTTLVRDPKRVQRWIDEFGPGFYAGIDALDGRVNIDGWEEDSLVKDTDLADETRRMGFDGIVYTSIAVDGTLDGPDLDRTNSIAVASGMSVILSGGMSSTVDVSRVVENAHERVFGMIVGKAIYEGNLDLAEAIALTETGRAGSRE
jgi:phosphoribosylformimino-5-aminoimidazole carboxamide ribotide isomerase